jgi:hypothetical protein
MEETNRRLACSFELNTRLPIKLAEQPGNLSLPDDFVSLYEVTNGLRSDWFHLLPFHFATM